jgi:hypothetical protein
MAIIVLLMVFNETFRHYFQKPLVQVGVYFFATFSLFSELLPFLFSSLSAWLFIGAGMLSLVIFGLYIWGLCAFATQLKSQKRQFFISILVITAAMNALYFTNIIPPIPLALREAQLYHSLKISNGQYVMTGEQENFLKTLIFGQTLHVQQADRVYLYTAIFAPTNLKTIIVDRWQYYDQKQKEWVSRGDLPFTINGGRQDGYKGYSWNSDLAEGKWRVYVQNQRGQVLAKVYFTVLRPKEPVILHQIVR